MLHSDKRLFDSPMHRYKFTGLVVGLLWLIPSYFCILKRMDFLDPKKKRAHRTRLFIGYGLMTIAIGIATTIIAFEAFGFGLDRHTGTVIQNGLLFIDVHPEPAQITLNGEDKGQTDARLVIPDGQYTVQLKRDGYRTWQRTFRLEGSKIERLVYPFLFPEKLDSDDIQLYSETPAFSTQSLDRKWVLVQRPGSINSFDLYDLSSNNVDPVELTLPDALFTNVGTGTHSLELADWSTDNRHVLVKHIYEGGFEFIMVDREQPALSTNVNRTINRAPTAITMRDKKFDELYIHTLPAGTLELADIGTNTIRPILSNVLTYKTYSTEEILFVTNEGAEVGKTLVKIRTSDKVYALRELPAGDPGYLLDISKFDGRWFMVAGASLEKKVYVYKDPFDTLNKTSGNRRPIPETVLKTDNNAQNVSFSANVRFISLQGGNQFAVYDAENDKLLRFNTKFTLAETEKARWMDGHRLTLTSEGRLKIFEFDGNNSQDLIGMQGNHLPYFDRDYDRFYTISPSGLVENRTALVQSYVRTATDR